MGIKPLPPHYEKLLHTFVMQYKIKVQGNIETVGVETLLNNRLLLKGIITFAKMYDTFWQKPFYIKMGFPFALLQIVKGGVLW